MLQAGNLQVNRVTKVLKGGKLMKFRAVVVSGDRLGTIGYGVASAREVAEAVQRASAKAQLNAVGVPIVGARTFPHKFQIKERASRIMLRPAAEGTGVIAGGAVRTVLELAGYQNCFAKIYGTKSNMNNTRATIKALHEMWTWDEIAEKRGCTIDYAMGRVPEPDLIYLHEEEDFEEVEVAEGEELDGEIVEEIVNEMDEESFSSSYKDKASVQASAEDKEDYGEEEQYSQYEDEDDSDSEGNVRKQYSKR
jgi:small subunit ribosomal protein S5